MGVSQREGNYPKNISIMKSKYLTEEAFTKYGASWRDVDYQISIYGPLPAREGVNMQMHCCGKSPQQQSGQAQSKVGRKSKAKQQFRKAKQKHTAKKNKAKSKAKRQSKGKQSIAKTMQSSKAQKTNQCRKIKTKLEKQSRRRKLKQSKAKNKGGKTCKHIKMTSSGRDSCSVTECKFWKEIEQNF